jgi:hypothetical protein
MTAMRDMIGPEAEPLASWLAHENIDGLTPVLCSQKYWANRLYSLRRRALVASVSSLDSVRPPPPGGPSATGWLTVHPSPALGNACPPNQLRLLLCGLWASPFSKTPSLANVALDVLNHLTSLLTVRSLVIKARSSVAILQSKAGSSSSSNPTESPAQASAWWTPTPASV